jgi:hypothetical protein
MTLALSTVTVESKAVRFATNKSGEGVVIVSQKELGKITGLKGSALKKAHFEYRLEAGKAMNAALSAGMASGEIIGRSAVPTKSGDLKVMYSRVSNLKAPAEKTAKPVSLAQQLVNRGKFATLAEAEAFLA